MGTKKDQNAAEQTLNPTVSFPASLRIYCKSWTSKSWGGSTSMALLVMLTWLLSLAGSSSPLQFFSLFLTSPNSWGCHCVFGFTLSFTHCPLGCTMPGLPSRLLNYRWKPFWSHNSGILHVTETSTISMTLRSASTQSSFLLFWLYVSSVQEPNPRYKFPMSLPFWNKVFWGSLLKAVFHVCNFETAKDGVFLLLWCCHVIFPILLLILNNQDLLCFTFPVYSCIGASFMSTIFWILPLGSLTLIFKIGINKNQQHQTCHYFNIRQPWNFFLQDFN